MSYNGQRFFFEWCHRCIKLNSCVLNWEEKLHSGTSVNSELFQAFTNRWACWIVNLVDWVGICRVTKHWPQSSCWSLSQNVTSLSRDVAAIYNKLIIHIFWDDDIWSENTYICHLKIELKLSKSDLWQTNSEQFVGTTKTMWPWVSWWDLESKLIDQTSILNQEQWCKTFFRYDWWSQTPCVSNKGALGAKGLSHAPRAG